ncbi:methyltransferase domain-containing protein [Colletotrichum incanum]|nr:methyltransferase domain-containing protein [Colletotrichum incanum]
MSDARPADGDATTLTMHHQPEAHNQGPNSPVAVAVSRPTEPFFQFRLSDPRMLDETLHDVEEALFLDGQDAGTHGGVADDDAQSDRPSVDATEDGVTVDRVAMNDAASLVSIDDITEQFRLDIQHLLWLATWDGRLCMCPKKDGAARVLDVGTGTGVWAMAYADEHPEAIVTGVDISPIQPQVVAPNCFFEIYNVESEWPWRIPHDFIFMRHMNTAFASWSETIEKAFRNLAPGGYIELQDNTFPIMSYEGSMPPNSAIARWSTMLMDSTRLLGRPCDAPSQFKQLLEDAGFEGVVEIKRVWPIGQWAAGRRHFMTGSLCHDTSIAGLEPSTLRLFTSVFGWSVEETKDFCREVEAEIRSQRYHAYFNVYCVYGMKPYWA